MKPSILLIDPYTYGEAEAELRERLHASFEPTLIWTLPDPDQHLKRHGPEIRGVMTRGGCGVETRILDMLPNLEIISQVGNGTEKTPVAYARQRGIPVTNTPDVLTDDVADLAIGLMLAVSRGVGAGERYVRSGRWPKEGRFPLARKVSGKTCAIVGLGRIGKVIARRAEAFDMPILYHNRRPAENIPYAYYPDLELMARDADFLVVVTPGGPETRHLIDERILRALGPEGVLVNVGRGSSVDEEALVRLLKEGAVGGAGLDVHAREPHADPALIEMDNVVLLPHLGSSTRETRRRMQQLCLDNLLAHFSGRPLLTPV